MDGPLNNLWPGLSILAFVAGYIMGLFVGYEEGKKARR